MKIDLNEVGKYLFGWILLVLCPLANFSCIVRIRPTIYTICQLGQGREICIGHLQIPQRVVARVFFYRAVTMTLSHTQHWIYHPSSKKKKGLGMVLIRITQNQKNDFLHIVHTLIPPWKVLILYYVSICYLIELSITFLSRTERKRYID